MLTNSKCLAKFESSTEVTGPTNLISTVRAESVAANASEFKDPATMERRERRRSRSGRNVRSLGSPMGGWKITSW